MPPATRGGICTQQTGQTPGVHAGVIKYKGKITLIDFTLVWQHKLFLLNGAFVTIQLTFGAVVIGILLGCMAGMGRISRNRFIRAVSSVYVYVLRGTPMLLQIFFIYFGIPQLYLALTGTPLNPSPIKAGIIALGINSGAYVAEIVRAGIQNVPKGQMEASRSLGMSHWQAMREIILPQAFRRVIPPLCNEFIVILKDTSLVSVIGASELMYSAKVMGARYYDYVQFLFGAGMVYLVLTFIISQVLAAVERKLGVSGHG
jgi:His/Glu/Gln/Arg/opine family amino acid ABC transporter permease subunit